MRNSFHKPGAKFISEYIPEIVSEIYERKRFILHAQPGAGKTTAAIYPGIESIAKRIHRETGLPVCMFMPINLLLRQQEEDTGLPVITGATSPQDAGAAIESGIFLANFASFGKVHSITGNNIVPIIDEIHLLPSASYMEGEGKNLSRLFDLFLNAPFALGLSGTPQKMFNQIGAPIIPARCETTQAVNLEVISSNKDSDITALESLLCIDKPGLSVVRVNDTILSQGMAEQLAEKGNISGRIIHINSDSSGSDREHLEQNQAFKDDVGLSFVTSVADIGVSVKNAEVFPTLIQTKKEVISPEEIAQFLKRFRSVDTISAKLFLKAKAVKSDHLFTDTDAVNLINSERKRNEAYAQLMNYTPEPSKQNKLISAFSDLADKDRIIKVAGKYQANELWLLREALRLRDKAMSTDEALNIAGQYLENLTVARRSVERGEVETQVKADLNEHKESARTKSAINAGKVHELILMDYKALIDTCIHSDHKSIVRDGRRWIRSFGYNENSSIADPEILQFLNDARPKDLKPLRLFVSMTTGREKHSITTVISVLNAASNAWYKDAKESVELHKLKAQYSEKGDYWMNLAESKQTFIDRLEGKPYYDQETMNKLLWSLEDLRLIHYTSASKLGTLAKRQEYRGLNIRAFREKIRQAGRRSEFFTRQDLKKMYLDVFGETQIDLAENRAVDLFKRIYEYRSRVEVVTDSKGKKVVRKDELFAVNSTKKFLEFCGISKISVPLEAPENRLVLAGIAQNEPLLQPG